MADKNVSPSLYPSDMGDRWVNKSNRGCDSYSLGGERMIPKASDT